MHGWLVIDKPVGPGSTQIVSAVKRALREGEQTEIGGNDRYVAMCRRHFMVALRDGVLPDYR